MRKNIIYICVIAFVFLAASCDRKADFKHETFVTLQTSSYSVSEIDGTLKIPVTVYNPTNDEIRVAVTLNSDVYGNEESGKNAVEGVNYNLVSPATGVLTFAPNEDTKEIEIELLHDTRQTGSKYFELSIASLDGSYNVGNLSTASIKVRDKEHPLEMFLGDWIGDLVDLSYGTTETVVVSIVEDENDETYNKLKITNLDPISVYMTKVYSLKATANAEKTKISIACEQPIGYEEVSYQSYFLFYGFSMNSAGDITSLLNSVSLEYDAEKETLTIPNAFGTMFTYTDGEEYIYSIYSPGAVLTKKK